MTDAARIEAHNERCREIHEAFLEVGRILRVEAGEAVKSLMDFGALLAAQQGRTRQLDRIVANDLGLGVSKRRRQRTKNYRRWEAGGRRTR